MCLHGSSFFFFNDTATTEIYTLSLHDALPIYGDRGSSRRVPPTRAWDSPPGSRSRARDPQRSEEHTSELQSQSNLVCRLLLEKKKNNDDGEPTTPVLGKVHAHWSSSHSDLSRD